MIKSVEQTAPTKQMLSGLLGKPVIELKSLEGGRNSRTFSLSTEDGNRYVAKVYIDATASGRNRLEAEFSSLTFLHQKGVTTVPQPVAADTSMGCGVYSFVSGTAANMSEITVSDIDQTTQFLKVIHNLREEPEAAQLPAASEAFFSLDAVVDNLKSRLDRLNAHVDAEAKSEGLQDFLSDEFEAAMQEIIPWSSARLADNGVATDTELPLERRTLSPSDLGFHNCIRREDGQLVFLDFEYFGWDDPAKTASDYLLHPAMDLTHDLKSRFLSNFVTGLGEGPSFTRRLEAYYPLFGLKWSLILLNEFIPENFKRRRFARPEGVNNDEILGRQLAKSKRILQQIQNEYMNFPYYE